MSLYYYYTALGHRVSTSGNINMCRRRGPLSLCGADTIKDQEGCSYREDSTTGVAHCDYYRSDIAGHCDNMYAQRDIKKPEPVESTEGLTGKTKEYCEGKCPHRKSCLMKMKGETEKCKILQKN